jgi:acyl-CoA reductase-like NAD-dependent aldehyde dehydrogenase
MPTRLIPTRDPRTGEIDRTIEPLTESAVQHRRDRARRAQKRWHEIGIEGRIEALQEWKKAISSGRDSLLQALVKDTGRLSVSELEIDSFLSSIDRWCALAPELLTESVKTAAIPFIRIQQSFAPYPVVGIISPWNFPLLLSTIDTIPALLAGCAAIVKPSEIASRFVTPLMESIARIPDLQDVLTFIEGDGETGSALVQNVDLVCFTGSVATGRKVAEAAARRFIPAFLELGGKDPAIVLESADLERATSALLWGSVVNSGQSCLSIERIYVAESIFEPFIDRLIAKAGKVTLAYPELTDGEIGPIIAARQAEIIRDHLQDAIDKDAKICIGGQIEKLGGGWWCRPTVITGVNHSMKLMSEETFGPILPVMAFQTPDEAIALANDSAYGLSAAVFAGEENEALEIARHLDAGAISINDAALTALIHEGEKHSFKFSGLGGSRMGAAGFLRFIRKKAFLIKTNTAPDPWWFDR